MSVLGRVLRLFAIAIIAFALSTAAASAQDRPFVFSLTTAPDTSKSQIPVDYDLGVGEQTFQSSQENGPEQRVGVQASVGRWTLVGRIGLASTNAGDYQTSQQGEALFSLLTRASSGVSLAIGGGVLHEADGVDVWLTRIVAGRDYQDWRLHGNLLFEMPHGAPSRDAVDLISSIGWARRIGTATSIGVEGIGEDLEGFWDPTEAEGGARFLIGPSFHVSPSGRKWQLSIAGGPMFHPATSPIRSQNADRELPLTTRSTGYAIRTSFACTF